MRDQIHPARHRRGGWLPALRRYCG